MRELEVYFVGFDEMNLVTSFHGPGVFSTGSVCSGPIIIPAEEEAITLARNLEGSPDALSVFECKMVFKKVHPVPALQRLAEEAE